MPDQTQLFDVIAACCKTGARRVVMIVDNEQDARSIAIVNAAMSEGHEFFYAAPAGKTIETRP